jgi:Fe2+ or Zn2+ uptake regulation protein
METTFAPSDLYLRQRGIKASSQRVLIFEYLQQTSEHPSVSHIFSQLHSKIPNLSRATVYNTINLFLKKKIIVPVQLDGPEARYDLAEPRHAHFHCQVCHTIYDISCQDIGIPEMLEDFIVLETQLHYRGVCPQCR